MKKSKSACAELQARVFQYRGALLALPALALAAFGRPSALSVTAGLPLAFAGELLRCWAVGYSGATTRGDQVEAPELVTAGPYAHVRNPLYIGNAITALGFAIAFTGGVSACRRKALIGTGMGMMGWVYATIVPHEEAFLRGKFGRAFEEYCRRVPPVVPRPTPYEKARGSYDSSVIASAESRTFVSFGVMLLLLAAKAKRAEA